jgi:hypothetical protein
MADRDTIAVEYSNFLLNPQQSGVWVLTIQLDAAGLTGIQHLLNLDDYRFFGGARYIDADAEDSLSIPSTIVPRLFSYLRYLTPKKTAASLPPLFPRDETQEYAFRRSGHQRLRPYRYIHVTEPKKLGADKRKSLGKASMLYQSNFAHCTLVPSPGRSTGLDIVSRHHGIYFHALEELQGRIRFFSPQERVIELVRKLIESLPLFGITTEVVKLFSPESQLLVFYMPILRLVTPQALFQDNSVLRAVAQSLLEAKEERFTHAIRAIGIGAEELIVEIYETLLHEKAPEAPLGNLLNDLNERVQEILAGTKSKKSNISALKKQLGAAIKSEMKKKQPTEQLCVLLQAVIQSIIPTMEQMTAVLTDIESNAPRQQRTLIFPPHVNRCLADLVQLRNRVSHRVDRLSAVRTVNYLEAALAIKSFATLALWWHGARTTIDYKATKKDVIKKALDAAKAE